MARFYANLEKGLERIGMSILDFMGMVDPLTAAFYNIDKMFADYAQGLG